MSSVSGPSARYSARVSEVFVPLGAHMQCIVDVVSHVRNRYHTLRARTRLAFSELNSERKADAGVKQDI